MTCVFAIITKLEGVVGQVPYPEGFVNLGPLNGATRGGEVRVGRLILGGMLCRNLSKP